MSSTSVVNCPLGTLKGDKCQTASTDFHVLSNDQREILRLRSGCDAAVPTVCHYHWHKYFEISQVQQRVCMDPLGKHRKKVSKGLRVITLEMARLHHDLRLIPGKKHCPTCRSEVSKHDTVGPPDVELEQASETSSDEGKKVLPVYQKMLQSISLTTVMTENVGHHS